MSPEPVSKPSGSAFSAQAAVSELTGAYDQIRSALGRAIVGQETVVEQLLIVLFSSGHGILEGVPGLAKTLLISTLARQLSLSFSRVQFTPDLMPSDITGTEVIEEDRGTGARSLRFVKGPIFANVVLADEINRTPPKTQAALLEAMQENQVTAAGFPHPLPRPFFVLATQNPIEQEGTYPLPEAQLDRFMFKILVTYPSEEEEVQIVKTTTTPQDAAPKRILAPKAVVALQDLVRRVPCADPVIRYATRLVRMTRSGGGANGDDDKQACLRAPHGQALQAAPPFVRDYVSWGAGPRAAQHLVLAAKARAILQGRFYVSSDDIRAVALPTLRHRVLTNFNAEAEGVRSDDIIRRLIEVTPVGPPAALDDRTARRVFAEDASPDRRRPHLPGEP